MEILQNILGKRKYPFSTYRIEPDSSSDFAGQIIEYNNPVNIFKKLGYESTNTFSFKLLGKPAQRTCAIAIFRGKPDKKNIAAEYEIFVPLDVFQKQGIRKGCFVR